MILGYTNVNQMKKDSISLLTNDAIIRSAIRKNLQLTLQKERADFSKVKIIEELGITHGAARIDLAVVKGEIHGYELKSDLDTLYRLPEQMRIYNSVLDRVTLVVGKKHLFEAIKLVPEWWGITIAKIKNYDEGVSFYEIRQADSNPEQDSILVASLLWREEALSLLESLGEARGVRSKNRSVLYEKLASVLDRDTLKRMVRECLCTRVDWRSDLSYVLGGD